MSDANDNVEKDENGTPKNAVPMSKEELYSISSRVAILGLGVHQLNDGLKGTISAEKATRTIQALLTAYEMQNKYAMRLIAAHVVSLGVDIAELRAAVMENGKKFGEAMKDYETAMKAASAQGGPAGDNGTLH